VNPDKTPSKTTSTDDRKVTPTLVLPHKAIVSGMGWSPTGRLFACVFFTGEVHVWVTNSGALATHSTLRLNLPPDAPHDGAVVTAACWDAIEDVLIVSIGNELRYIDPTGRVAHAQAGLGSWLLRPCPATRRVALVEHILESGGSRHQIRAFDPASPTLNRPLTDSDDAVIDFAWATDGKRLAVLHPWEVAIYDAYGKGYFAVPGMPSKVIWIGESRLAVACADSNIRVYELLPSRRRGSSYLWMDSGDPFPAREQPMHLMGMLEHDAGITDLTPINASGLFASLDEDRQIRVWDSALALRFHHRMTGQHGNTSDAFIALNRESTIAIDIDRRLFTTTFEPLLVTASQTPATAKSSAIDGVLTRADLAGNTRPHSDAVIQKWGLPFDLRKLDELPRIRVLRAIAAEMQRATRLAGSALKLLWRAPASQVLVELENIGFAKTDDPDPVLHARLQLFPILLHEVDRGISPKRRLLASTAYVGIGALGAMEARAAFAADKIDSAMVHFESEVRQLIRTSTELSATPSDAQVLDHLRAANEVLDKVLQRAARASDRSAPFAAEDGADILQGEPPDVVKWLIWLGKNYKRHPWWSALAVLVILAAGAIEFREDIRHLLSHKELTPESKVTKPVAETAVAAADHAAGEATKQSVDAAKAIVSGCYRRAVFTRTSAQTSIPVMVASIADCRRIVQAHATNVVTPPDLKTRVARLVSELEAVEKEGAKKAPDADKINEIKQSLIGDFQFIAASVGSAYVIPPSPTGDYFADPERANGPPMPPPTQGQEAVHN
jgi:hypothetical protein